MRKCIERLWRHFDFVVVACILALAALLGALNNLRVADEQYRLGEASRIDYTDAVADYAAALGKRVKAFYEGQVAEARILRLTGGEPLYHHQMVLERED